MPDHDVTSEVENTTNRILLRIGYAAGGLLGMVVFAAGGWITSETIESRQFRMSGDRYTQADAARDRAQVMDRFADLPPQTTKDKLVSLDQDVRRLSDEVTRIKVLIERIEKGM